MKTITDFVREYERVLTFGAGIVTTLAVGMMTPSNPDFDNARPVPEPVSVSAPLVAAPPAPAPTAKSEVFFNSLNMRLNYETDIVRSIEMSEDREELLCLAINVYHEARGSSASDQIAVTYVVMNRVNDWRWPDTPCEVVWDNRQFSWTHDGMSDMPHDAEAWERSQRHAYLAYHGIVANPAGNANHYHTPAVNPHWTNVSARKLVGSHYYMTL